MCLSRSHVSCSFSGRIQPIFAFQSHVSCNVNDGKTKQEFA